MVQRDWSLTMSADKEQAFSARIRIRICPSAHPNLHKMISGYRVDDIGVLVSHMAEIGATTLARITGPDATDIRAAAREADAHGGPPRPPHEPEALTHPAAPGDVQALRLALGAFKPPADARPN
jgi:hypothetical protein